jgi:L,D-peptidoglycan transpeptidase YkuD (ErfK/YbiS/YcfS/YnhG family)
LPPASTTPATSPPTTPPPCPANLADELAHTGSARQLITVEAAGWGTSVASVELWQRQGGCWTPVGGPWSSLIGQNGFSDHHVEGDGTTPTGVYGLGPVMYGNQPDPGAHEPYHLLQCGDWWDEDPSSAGYNTFQHVPCGQNPPFGGGSEALWQETAPYPSFAVIDYNTGPIVKGAGSAIFLHAYTGSPTVGCVSIPLADLDRTLDWLEPADAPAFVMGPAGEIAGF